MGDTIVSLEKTRKKGVNKMDGWKRMEYVVERLDGDYAYLKNVEEENGEEKCVARALLPEAIGEGSRLAYEMLEYTLL